MNATLSASSGSMVAGLLTIILTERQEGTHTSGEFFNALNKAISNGVLAGLVSAGGCTVVSSWAALIAGGIGSLAMMASTKLLVAYQIDDVVAAVPVHLVCGIWGVIAPPFSLCQHTARKCTGTLTVDSSMVAMARYCSLLPYSSSVASPGSHPP